MLLAGLDSASMAPRDCWTCVWREREIYLPTRMWANVQRDGRPAEYRWRPLFNAAKFGWRPLLQCRAVTLLRCETSWNLQRCPKLPDWSQSLVGRKFTILWGHVEEILMFNKFLPIVDMCFSCEDIARQSCAMVTRWRFLATFLRPVFSANRMQHVSDLHVEFALGPHHVSKYGRHLIYDR